MITTRFPILALALAGVAGCGSETHVEIVASLEPAGPLRGLEVVALPYDPRPLLDSLAALSPTPRPDFSALEAELRAFRRPEYDEDDLAVQAWTAVRDSVRRLSDSLRGVDHRSGGYAAAYDRFRRLYERFLQKTAARDAQVREITGEVRELAIRASHAADSLRAWERQAYGGLDSAAGLAAGRTGREPVTGRTDDVGRLTMTLPRGQWWLVSAVPHPENPFLEYRWQASTVAAGLGFRLPLSEANAATVWRH